MNNEPRIRFVKYPFRLKKVLRNYIITLNISLGNSFRKHSALWTAAGFIILIGFLGSITYLWLYIASHPEVSTPKKNPALLISGKEQTICVVDLEEYKIVDRPVYDFPVIHMSISSLKTNVFVSDKIHKLLYNIDGVTYKVLQKIPVHNDPGPVVTNLYGEIFVLHPGLNSLFSVDAVREKETGVIPLDKNPTGMVISLGTGYIYVANTGSNNISIVDAKSRKVINSIALPGSPGKVALNSDKGILYVLLPETDEFAEVDVINGIVKGTFSCEGKKPFDIAIHPKGKHLYIAARGSNTVSVFSLPEVKFEKNLLTGRDPIALEFTARNELCVLNSGSDDLYIFTPYPHLKARKIELGINVAEMVLVP
ncbi:MAG: YncE family protein [Firmicutes bacterium]|nr:YncE family protein [Bacillota bacterium]